MISSTLGTAISNTNFNAPDSSKGYAGEHSTAEPKDSFTPGQPLDTAEMAKKLARLSQEYHAKHGGGGAADMVFNAAINAQLQHLEMINRMRAGQSSNNTP